MSYTTLVSADTLSTHLDDPNWLIVDCRFSLAEPEAGHRAYRQHHIPGARYADLNQDLSAPIRDYTGRHPLPDFRALTAKLIAWGVSARHQVVVYDDASGAFAGRLWWLLRAMGHDRVAVLDGDYRNWRRLGKPVTTILPKPISGTFRCYLDDSRWLNANKVRDGLAKHEIVLIDARTPERFAGRQEPIDPVAGHVPGARNRPFQANLDSKGFFLPANYLKAQFQDILGPIEPRQVVHMCGSGVTACHNLLAMEIAGLGGSRLYAGSWSEWIRDRNRPLAKG
ncbi:sulfurtransferase [Methylomonas sp. UP202]|uniref:sulfurtransferase n=1 Tax=Methylomonas sp. UP202 TaxID=3040943 RepID=UPI002479DA04|nr:sulfurtransferase [Methylomonas sp. UP202]WGS87559.1 sulfurtransferase [Methylomonas sp. UP202]